MRVVRRTSQFKKDFKRILNNPIAVSKVLEVVKKLEEDAPIPKSMCPHKLTGNYKGCMECHIENDLLLIWIDESKKVVKLLRLGNHSELF